MRFQELENLRVGVWGAGKEGRSIIQYLQKTFPEQAIVLIDDQQPDNSLLAELATQGKVEFIQSNQLNSVNIPLDVIIKSPGVSRYRAEIENAKSQGIYITTATNLWLAEVCNHSRVIAVTGTKGKSTTASVLAFLLQKAGVDVALGGNIGIPLTDLLQQNHQFEIYVAELSSYQLSDLDVWPQLGIMLNLYPEHIDWHETTEKYYRDKFNLFSAKGDCLPIINAQDATIAEYGKDLARRVYFNSANTLHVENNQIMDGDKFILSGADLKLKGQHNLLNICAALTVVKQLGLEINNIAAELADFSGLAHRLEIIGECNDLTFVDDSISTTPESAIAALETFAQYPITLLLGGKDRQQDYQALAKHLARQRVFAVITMHENGDRVAADIAEALKDSDYLPLIIQEKDLINALNQAKAITPKGGVVLLSPAAPSYDAYKNFQERGLLFRELSAV